MDEKDQERFLSKLGIETKDVTSVTLTFSPQNKVDALITKIVRLDDGSKEEIAEEYELIKKVR